ncbi:MAG: acylphosphatase [Myxococcales bacterium]
MKETVRARLTITGRVQGVAYRASAQDEGQRLGLVGEVRNLSNGSVEALVEGSRPAVEDFIRWCRRGPPAARVLDVKVAWSAPSGEFSGFEISH